MAVTAWKEPSTVSTADRASGKTWANTDRAKTYNSQGAWSALVGTDHTDWLRSTNYGFTSTDIPVGATINGIEIRIYRWRFSDVTKDGAVYLRDGTGQVGSDLKNATNWTGSDTAMLYGGAADMCGTALTQADIVATTFGIDLSADATVIIGSAYVDVCQIRVYYTVVTSGIKKFLGKTYANMKAPLGVLTASVKKLMGVA